MTQEAIIRKKISPEKAEAEVIRGTSCGDDCASCGVCKYASKIRVEVINDLCAQIGDRVQIETQSSRILGAVTLVYIMPFILFFVGYAVAWRLGMGEGGAVLMSFAFLAVGLVAAAVISRLRKNSPITYRITKIIGREDSV